MRYASSMSMAAAEFDAARRAMLRAWEALCRAGMSKDDAAEEVAATASAMRQIAANEE